MSNRIALLLSLAALLPAGAQQHHASPRDAFWSASDLFTVAPNPARHKPSAVKSKAPPTNPAPNDDGIVGEQTTHPKSAVELVSANGYGAAPHLVRASESRLGLRYSVLLRGPDGQYSEVAPGTIFHSGDHIRLSLMANEPGYLYVISQGSSGNWSPLFPRAGSAAERIAAGTVQQIPAKQSFLFNDQTGEEKLFVILSRSPIADLDQKIQSLKGSPSKTDTPAPPTPDSGGQLLEAENHIPDVFVQQLASRDLVLVDEEKVNEAPTASHDGEKAVYVVSKMTSAQGNGSEVVASIKLQHQ
jgi:hypothetical protein